MKRKSLFLLMAFMAFNVSAQTTWYNPQNEERVVVHNQGWHEEGVSYQRLPERAKSIVYKDVWKLSKMSSGLSLRFKTNSSKISVKYSVSEAISMPHMPATGVSGVDLYREADAAICFGNYSIKKGNVQYDYVINPVRSDQGDFFTLYLPLYNDVKKLEIGVEEYSAFEFVPVVNNRPVVVYGTSIAQGACAPRPAMAWTNILSRSLDYPVVNLGFSGNGKLEKEVLGLMSELKARVFVLDCLPNLTNLKKGTVKELVKNAVKTLRAKRPDAAILLVEHAGYADAKTNIDRFNSYNDANMEQASAYRELKEQGVKDIYYLGHDDIYMSQDSWVDATHPSAYGMKQMATAVEKKIKKIFRLQEYKQR